MPFRINAKSFIVTYPQCSLDKEWVAHWFGTRYETLGGRVAKERHADGEPHIHVVFHMERALQSRNERVFDIDYEGRVYHPNIQSTRCLPAAYEYLTKDGDYQDWGTVPKNTTVTWGDVASATSKEEALRLAKEKSPRDYVLNYEKLLSFCEHHFADKPEPYEPIFNDFLGLPEPIQQWVDQRLNVRNHTF